MSSVSPSPSASPSPSTDDRKERFEAELNSQLSQMKQERRETVQANAQELKQRLDDAKKKVCEAHQTQINTLMNNMDKRRQNAFERIGSVSDAVQAYVTKNNLTVPNYADLVAKVDAAKTIAQTAMDAQQNTPEFDCSGEHPRADVTDFKSKRSDSIDAMKAYREAVRALVQAVKAVADTSKEVQ
jgi:predicted transcriptional regulator